MIPRLQEKYQGEIRPKLKGLDKYENIHQVPKIEKIIVHMGVSPQLGKDVLEDAIKDLTTITGRKPALNKAKISVANFKLRQGMNTGCRVTLRRQGMYEFLDRLGQPRCLASVTSAESTPRGLTAGETIRWA